MSDKLTPEMLDLLDQHAEVRNQKIIELEAQVEQLREEKPDWWALIDENERLRAALAKAEEMATACETLVEHSHEDQADCCELGGVLEDNASRQITDFLHALDNSKPR